MIQGGSNMTGTVYTQISPGHIWTTLCMMNTLVGKIHMLMSIIVQQDATIYSLVYFCKLLYMFRVVPPPIIRSTCNCNYSIWYLLNRYCYLTLSWRSRKWSSDSSTVAATSKYGLTSARCCNYSYMCSWWWIEVPPEICSADLQKYNKLYIVAS